MINNTIPVLKSNFGRENVILFADNISFRACYGLETNAII